MIANATRGDRADAGRQPVDAVGEVHDVHHRDEPDDRQRRAERRRGRRAPTNGSVMFVDLDALEHRDRRRRRSARRA